MPVISWVPIVVKFSTWAVCVRSARVGQNKRNRVNCNLSHDKELFIRGLNWLGGQEDWREKFGGTGGVSCQRQGPVSDLWLYSNQNTSHNAPLPGSLMHIRVDKEKQRWCFSKQNNLSSSLAIVWHKIHSTPCITLLVTSSGNPKG